MITITAIKNKLDYVITNTYGSDLYVYKFNGFVDPNGINPRKNIYNYKTKTYNDPIEVRGRAIIEPTEEITSFIGSTEKFDAAFLFVREELVRKFPSSAENDWIGPEDRITYNNINYLIKKVYPTGHVEDENLIVVALGMTEKGASLGHT